MGGGGGGGDVGGEEIFDHMFGGSGVDVLKRR